MYAAMLTTDYVKKGRSRQFELAAAAKKARRSR